ALGQRHVERPARAVAAGPVPLPERRQYPDRRIEAGDAVADADPDPHRRQLARPGRMVGQVAQAADRLADHAEGGAVAIGAGLAVAGNMGDDQVGPRPPKYVDAETELRQLAGPEILDQHVALRDEAEHQVLRTLMLQ